MITFHEIAGVLLAYDRDSHEAYGTRGRALGAAGPVTETFLAALELWMDELGELCPWGKPELLVTGGVRGNQPAPGNDPSASLSALLRQSIDGPVVLRHSEPWTVGMVEQELLKAFPHLRKTGNLRKAAEQVRFLQALRMNGHPLT